MDYAKLSERIKQHIARNPSDHVPYMDLLSVCRQLEPDDFTLAHELSKDLRKLSSAALHKCSANAADSLFDVYKKAMCFDAPHDFDTFLLYIEMNRKPEKKFYAPRRHYLRPIVAAYQEVLDGKLRLLTLSMPKRAGKSQLGINFVNFLSGREPEKSSLMEGTGDDLVKSFYSGCLEYLQTPNEYLFYDVFPNSPLVQTNADTKILNLRSKSRFPTVMCRSIDARQVGLSEATNVLYLDDCVEGREEAKTARDWTISGRLYPAISWAEPLREPPLSPREPDIPCMTLSATSKRKRKKAAGRGKPLKYRHLTPLRTRATTNTNGTGKRCLPQRISANRGSF